MATRISQLLLLLFSMLTLSGQEPMLLHNSHHTEASSYDPQLKPFYHGVASGDPLQDRIIIWTRFTPDSATFGASVTLNWVMATDTAMRNIVQSGSTVTDSSRDFTAKVDVQGLQAGTTYYYYFEWKGHYSLIGRTRTLPSGPVSRVKLGVVSCNNYEAGYFHGFEKLAGRHDLDAIIHLGDYIYEYRAGQVGDSASQRFVQPFETVNLAQYRARYSLYRLDEDLRKAHQQHAFINIWDDHESANDSWKGGASNHQPNSEGLWSDRKAASKKAFYEWLPIRESQQGHLYRSFNFGQLADLILLDTRLEGRDKQVSSVNDPQHRDSARSLLGDSQRHWFTSALSQSAADWRLIGNQVLFAQLQLGWAAPYVGMTPRQLESEFMDIWDGYPAERQRIISYLDSAGIQNTVFLTGDFHSSFAFDIADTVVDDSSDYAAVPNYDPVSGNGSVAVEFATPSITSANFDENSSRSLANIFEAQINRQLPGGNNPNPHMKYVDLDRHGYIVLDVRPDSVKANWYYVNNILDSVSGENYGSSWKTLRGQNHLEPAVESSPGVARIPAPSKPFQQLGLSHSPLTAFSLYPNPAGERLFLQLGLLRAGELSLEIRDLSGRLIHQWDAQNYTSGIKEIQLPLPELVPGNYLLLINYNGKQYGLNFQKRLD